MNTVDKYLEQAGFKIRYRAKDELIIQFCPFHSHHSKTPSLSINTKTKQYNCFACGNRGTLNKLISHFGIKGFYYTEKVEDDEIEKLLNGQENTETKLEDKDVFRADTRELANYRFHHPYLETRGFTKKFILENKIGFNKRALRATIPIFFKGQYWGCAQRSVVGDEPKIVYPTGLPKEEILYVPPAVKTLLNPPRLADTLLITEGPLDALKAVSLGVPAVAVQGCLVFPRQWEWIRKFAEQHSLNITLSLDNDKAGRKGIENFIEKMDDIFEVKIFQYSNEKKDPGDLNKNELQFGIENSISILEWS